MKNYVKTWGKSDSLFQFFETKFPCAKLWLGLFDESQMIELIKNSAFGRILSDTKKTS